MATQKTRKGPGRSRSQTIGDIARSALYANKPDNWNLQEIPGDDFGSDFHVTAFDPDGNRAQCTFYLQLKGTTKKTSRLADGKNLAYSFDLTTLTMWDRSATAIVIVIVDLIDTEDPKLATVHYNLVNYDLENALARSCSDQKTVRLRVPINQTVHKHLDILPTILPYLDARNEAWQRYARHHAPGAASLDGVTLEPTEPYVSTHLRNIPGDEIEEIINTSADKIKLQAALAALREGEYERVLELCPHPIADACTSSPKESAIAAHLRAMAADALGDSREADGLSVLAECLYPDCGEIVGSAAQRRLNTIPFGNDGLKAREELLESLKARSELAVVNIKSKILALNGDFDEARRIVNSLPLEKIIITKIIISVVERAWERALEEVSTARALPALKPKQRMWLDVLEARGRLELALRFTPMRANSELVVYSSGLPGIDYDELRLAYDSSRRAMVAAQRLNWPADINLVLDVFPISAMLLGLMAEAMPLLSALGLARVTVTPIREVVAKIAVQFDRPDIALQLSERAGTAPRFEHELSVMAVAKLNVGQTAKALEIVTDDYLADPSSKDAYMTSLLMLGIAADSALRGDLLEKIRSRLDRDTDTRHWLAILDSVVVVQQSLLQRPTAINNLYAYWCENERPKVVGYHLLANINPQSEDEAKLFVDIAASIEISNSLGCEDSAKYGQSLITIGHFDEAAVKLRTAYHRFRNDPKIKLLLGIALEAAGQPHEAFKLFEELLNDGKASDTARHYFVEIAMRMGFFERAEEQVRNAYAKTTARDQKLRLLNILFQLLVADGKNPEQLEGVAWEYGKLANRSDEREEAIFLQEYMVATLPTGLRIKSERIEEFRQRLNAYCENFPNSRLLRCAEVPENGPPELIIAALKQATGITEENLEQAKITEERMDRGALQVPFSWRPGRFLSSIPDIFMLWEIRKAAPPEKGTLHFRTSIPGYNRQVPSNIGAYEPVLSLTSLLLLDELGLLSLVLDTFPRLVVARAVLVVLQDAGAKFPISWGREKATRIIKQLQEHFNKISHPPRQVERIHPEFPGWYQEEKRAMEQSGKVYFSDDIIETSYVCNGESTSSNPSISTVDFLSWADQSCGIISPYDVSDAIGHMVRLQVIGMKIEQRYFIAAIPDALNTAPDQAQAEVALQNARTFNSILDGVWNHFKPFEDLRNHFCANMSYLLNKGEASEEVLVALWLHWLKAIRFQPTPNTTPLFKMTSAFCLILGDIKPESPIVSRHWRSFWTVLQRGLRSELNGPEDLIAIESVATCLGVLRGKKESEDIAMDLFEKARMGLEHGTKHFELFNSKYIHSAAQQATKS